MGMFDFIGKPNQWANSAASSLFGLSGANTNPANAASPYLDKLPGVGQQYYDPYVQQGQQAGGQANELYQRFAQDPSGYFDELMQGYKPTAAYQTKYDRAMKESRAASNAGGYTGSDLDVEDRSRLSQRLADEDMQQYLQNILGIQGTGLQGLQHQGDQGFQASGNLADYLGQAYNAQGQNAYSGAAQQGANQSQLFNSLLKLGGTALGSLGGPGGAAIGGALGGALGGGQQGTNDPSNFQQWYGRNRSWL